MRKLSLASLIVAIGIVAGSGFLPVAADDIDPEVMVASRKLVELTNGTAAGEQIITMLAPQLRVLTVRANPGKETEIAELFDTVVLPMMHDSMPEMVELSARIFARNFTMTELNELIAFYESPIGRKLLAKQSKIIEEAGAAGQEWAALVRQKIRKDYTDEFEKRGLLPPA